MMRHAFRPLVSAFLVALTLAACSAVRKPDTDKQADNMIFASYTAADTLIQLAGERLDPSVPILVATVADIDNLDKSSSFGRLLAEQVATRLVNSGYTVVDATMRQGLAVKEGVGQLVLSRDTLKISHAQGAQAVIAGTYTVAEKRIYVNLRLLRAADGRVVAAHDFAVERGTDARYLSEDSSGWVRVR